MTSSLFIGLDCGTSVIKAAAFDSIGAEVAVGEGRLATASPGPGRMEFDPEALWEASAGAINDLLHKLGNDAGRVAALAVTGAGNGVILTDPEGRPVRPGVLAVDNRAATLPDRSEELRAINGQCQWPGQTATLLRWFAAKEPATLQCAAKVFVIKDYVKWRLCGAYVSDFSEQSKIGLLDIADSKRSGRLLDGLGVDGLDEKLPQLAESCKVAGRLAPEAASRTGLPGGLPVVNGLADIDASALGAGASAPGHLSIVAGTWSINQLFTAAPSRRPDIFGTSLHAVPGVWEVLEASASSTANLTWFVREACRDLESRAQAQGVSVYELVNREVAEVAPCTTPVFFHPYLFGSNTEPNARAGFYGLAGWQERRHLLAALFEGVVFSHVLHVERLLAKGEAAAAVFLSGGASRSKIWSQMFADALGLPLSVPQASEVGALGAAMCAAVAIGCHADLPSAASAMSRPARRHAPDPTLHKAYRARFETFKTISNLMKPIWAAIESAIPTYNHEP